MRKKCDAKLKIKIVLFEIYLELHFKLHKIIKY